MKQKRFLYGLFLILIIFIITSCSNENNNTTSNNLTTNNLPSSNITTSNIDGIDENKELYVKDTSILSIGGCCAMYTPKISPHDENLFLTTSDMGGLYVSQDGGKSFIKNNLKGRVYASCFDPEDENVIYAGGSCIYKSDNKGSSFELIFPKEEDIYKVMTKDENNLYYYYTKDSSYPTYCQVKDIIVNPNNTNEIYALYDYYGEIILFKSEDKGQNFTRDAYFLNRYNYNNKDNYGKYNEMIYDANSGELIICKNDGIYKLIDKELVTIYKSNTYLIDVELVYEDNTTYFIVIEKESNNTYCDTSLFYTSDFINIVYLDDMLIKQEINHQQNWEGRTVEFNLNFEHLTASSINNIYVTQGSYGTFLDNNTAYDYEISSIIRISNNQTSWLYGPPSITKSILTNSAWIDGCYDMFGICINPFNEGSFLFTTLCGIYFAKSNDIISQCYSNVHKNKDVLSYSSTGIDCQTSYGIRQDPFDENHIIMLNTDLGLSYSYDGGKTFNWSFEGVKEYRNTLYDAYFDKNKKDVLYGLWSSRHDAPYYVDGDETTNVYGCFAISYDGGLTWDSTYSSGIPNSSIPVKMSVVENEDNLTIYVATFNEGFYVSYDSGKTFKTLNEGITPLTYNTYNYIYGCDIETDGENVYCIVSKTNYFNEIQPGHVYKLVNNKWEEIFIDENLTNPRDLCIYDGKLYISCVAKNKYDWYEKITNYRNICGGIYLYDNGNVTQIFDEETSVAGVCFNNEGVMFLSDICGNVYYYNKNTNEYVKIIEEYHMISKGITCEDGILYLPTFGGGLLKIEIEYR